MCYPSIVPRNVWLERDLFVFIIVDMIFIHLVNVNCYIVYSLHLICNIRFPIIKFLCCINGKNLLFRKNKNYFFSFFGWLNVTVWTHMIQWNEFVRLFAWRHLSFSKNIMHLNFIRFDQCFFRSKFSSSGVSFSFLWVNGLCLPLASVWESLLYWGCCQCHSMVFI